MCVCLYVLCGHLLGKGWPLGSRLWCLTVSLSLSLWYPGSDVVLDCIDSWSLHPYLLCLIWFFASQSTFFLVMLARVFLGWTSKDKVSCSRTQQRASCEAGIIDSYTSYFCQYLTPTQILIRENHQKVLSRTRAQTHSPTNSPLRPELFWFTETISDLGSGWKKKRKKKLWKWPVDWSFSEGFFCFVFFQSFFF